MSNSQIKQIDPSQIRYTPEEGEIIQNPQGEYLIWKDGQWMKINIEGSNFNMELYDINKQIIAQLPTLTELKDKIDLINLIHTDYKNQYYMLYGKEISYFTLFKIINPDPFGADVIDCLNNLGEIKAIDLTENKDALEIWVIYGDEPTCLYLFPYDVGLVRVGE